MYPQPGGFPPGEPMATAVPAQPVPGGYYVVPPAGAAPAAAAQPAGSNLNVDDALSYLEEVRLVARARPRPRPPRAAWR